MLKTIRKEEFKLMKSILKDYYDHLTQDNQDSLISRIYGLHKVIFYRKKAKTHKKIYFCIMNNVFNTPKKIDVRYDLKGSTRGRTTKFPPGVPRDDTVALKDLDWLESGTKIKIDRRYKKKLLEVIRKDVDFFAKCQINDYSLLVGIHDIKKHQKDEDSPSQQNVNMSQGSDGDLMQGSARNSVRSGSQLYAPSLADSIIPIGNMRFYEKYEGGMAAIDGSAIYYLGIIDIFTHYGCMKKAEHVMRSIQYDSTTISCIPPPLYAERFYKFMEKALN